MGRRTGETFRRLAETAKGRGINHQQLAEKAGVSPQAISSYKNGVLPDVIVGQLLAKQLGCTVEEAWPLEEVGDSAEAG